jgi:hypothetical protein
MDDYSTEERRDWKLGNLVRNAGRHWTKIARLIGGSPRYDLTDYTEADEGMHWSDNADRYQGSHK